MKTDNTVTEREFQELRERILHQLAPATALQHFWAEKVVYCYWRYELARRLECRVIVLGPSSTEEHPGLTQREEETPTKKIAGALRIVRHNYSAVSITSNQSPSVPGIEKEAYYLMSIHKHLPPQARKDLKDIGWTKGRELAKLSTALLNIRAVVSIRDLVPSLQRIVVNVIPPKTKD
jgi:hypothetical protein